MKLKARTKNQSIPENNNGAEQIPVAQPPQTIEPDDTLSCTLSMQINTLLYNTLQNMITSSHTANDFTYISVADVIRAAIVAYQEGMELTELDQAGKRKNISIRVTKAQHDFYKSLPNRMRRTIVERAIRTFLKEH